MAGRKRGRRVRTSAQRAQLKKAQLASARKRRRNRVKRNLITAGQVAGSFAGTIALYHATQYGKSPSKLRKDINAGKAYIGKRKVKKLTPAISSRPTVRHNGVKGVLLG